MRTTATKRKHGPKESIQTKAAAERILLSLPEAAAALGISKTTLQLEINAGKIAIVRVRRRTMIARSTLETYVKKSIQTA